jgi:arabinose-5-phosphate isomerase
MKSGRKTPPSDRPPSALASARRTLAIESAAIDAVSRALDARIERAVDILASCAGKVVVVGMGKSGIICRKIAATLASTGTPASFLHAAEAVHGDFGVVGRADAVLALSHSGETEEMLRLLPLVKRFSLPLIAVTGNTESTLGRAADVTLDTSVPEEACPMGLAPTASTTAALALGDALAVALLERKGFSEEDFAVLHPAGSLGRKLLRVGELMHVGDEIPRVAIETSLADAIVEMTGKRLGVTGVVDEAGLLVGIITDGDLRRAMGAMRRELDVRSITAADVMTRNPQTIDGQALAAGALAKMQERSITSLFVVENGRPAGIVHLHDLLKAGIT